MSFLLKLLSECRKYSVSTHADHQIEVSRHLPGFSKFNKKSCGPGIRILDRINVKIGDMIMSATLVYTIDTHACIYTYS
jgi:hypothetical protein